MEIGDIFTIEIPPTNGHEQAGLRPAIIFQTSQFENQLPTVIIIPLTSKLTAQTFPGTLLLQPDAENGLSMDSVVLLFQLRAVDKKRLKRKIGRVNKLQLEQMCQQIKSLMGLQ